MPNAVAAATNVARDRRGRIMTDPTLRSTSDPRVSFGDCASTPAPDGKPYPALAQHAVRAARVVARNVAAAVDGRPPTPFVYEPLGMMAAFGHTRAACDVRDQAHGLGGGTRAGAAQYRRERIAFGVIRLWRVRLAPVSAGGVVRSIPYAAHSSRF